MVGSACVRPAPTTADRIDAFIMKYYDTKIVPVQKISTGDLNDGWKKGRGKRILFLFSVRVRGVSEGGRWVQTVKSRKRFSWRGFEWNEVVFLRKVRPVSCPKWKVCACSTRTCQTVNWKFATANVWPISRSDNECWLTMIPCRRRPSWDPISQIQCVFPVLRITVTHDTEQRLTTATVLRKRPIGCWRDRLGMHPSPGRTKKTKAKVKTSER